MESERYVAIILFSILPSELVTKIVLRLPVKSLLKFRSVSKSWLALISSPEFVKNHLNISANSKDYAHHRLMLAYSQPECRLLNDCSLSSVICKSVVEVSHLNYPMEKKHKDFWNVVGSVNGLICLSNDQEKVLCLWNPSTRKYKKFPDVIINFMVRVVYGFGYDEFHDDYKVVRYIYYYGSRSRFDVNLYSLKDDSWRSVCYPPPNGVRFWGSGKFVNGKLHWANSIGPVMDNGWNIISIDLTSEKWEKVDPPCWGEGGVLVLGVLGNNLSVIRKDSYPRIRTEVWVMKEYGIKESWTKMFTFRCPHSPASSMFKSPYLVSYKDEILLMFGEYFLFYNLKDESIRYPEFTEFESGLEKAIYVESLVSPILQS